MKAPDGKGGGGHVGATVRAVVAVAALLLASCAFEVVVGSGDEISETHSFDEELRGVRAGSSFEVEVSLGEDPEAVVIADHNLHDHLEVEVRDGILHLGVRDGVQVRNATLVAEVQVQDVEVLRTSGSATLEAQGPAPSPRLELRASGSSEVHAVDVAVEDLEVQTSGSAAASVSGEADRVRLDGSGSSSFGLGETRADELDVSLSGSATAEVTLEGEGTAQLSGSSRLVLHGDGSLVRSTSTGSSRIETP